MKSRRPETRSNELRIRRRPLLGGAAALGAGWLIGCDGETPGLDAGRLPDAGPRPDAGASLLPYAPRDRTYETFEHGVASGDPLPDAVILWTRITVGPEGTPDPGSIDVTYEVASDPSIATVVTSGTFSTDASRDFTVKVDVDGLSAATTYYYRFTYGSETSPIGRTRTAPSGPTDRLRFGVCSCSSLGHGFFHGYAKLAARADLDAVLHLGDYIYEYGSGGYGGARLYEPMHEIVSLDDYRARYSQYRREPELFEAHRQHPFIAVWDDHETANNSYHDGAENHDPATEGSWTDRLAAAAQAYREWMPIREQTEPLRIWRSLVYGDLVELIMLDTRIWGRDLQVEDSTDPRLTDPTRGLLGADQEAFLLDRLETSTSQWKLLGQQVMMAPLTGFTNTDQWDGYPVARARLLEAIRTDAVEDIVVLTGDIHSSWCFDLPEDPAAPAYDPSTGAGSLAVEIVVPGISSPGFPDFVAEGIQDDLLTWNPHLRWSNLVRRGYAVLDVTRERAHVDWYLTGDPEDPMDESEEHGASYAVEAGTAHFEEADGEAPPPGTPPPLAP